MQNEEKRFISKTFDASPSEKLSLEPEKNANKTDLNSTAASLATMSKVDIAIDPLENNNCKSEHSVNDEKPRHLSVPNVTELEIVTNNPQFKAERLQKIMVPCSETENVDCQKTTVDARDRVDDTMKLLQPVSHDPNAGDQVRHYFLRHAFI